MMKARIDVKNRKEAEAIKRGLEDKETRALVVLMGLLLPLPSNRSRVHVLRFVDDTLAEQDPNHIPVFSR
jgi:hypothetical protein